MKKSNTVYLFTRYTKEVDCDTARKMRHFESYSAGIATFRHYYDNVEDFIEADKSNGFGIKDSIGEIQSYYKEEENDNVTKCIDIFNDPKYRNYWEIPDSGIHMSKSLTCHDHYGSPIETDSDCGNCSGVRCCDNPSSSKKILYTVWNSHTGEDIVTTFDKKVADELVRALTLTEEATMAFHDICEMLKIDSDEFRNKYPELDMYQLVFRLSNEYGVRVKSRY